MGTATPTDPRCSRNDREELFLDRSTEESPPFETRAYQIEMFEHSMQSNTILTVRLLFRVCVQLLT